MIAWLLYGYALAIVGRIERFFGLGNYPEPRGLVDCAGCGRPRDRRDDDCFRCGAS